MSKVISDKSLGKRPIGLDGLVNKLGDLSVKLPNLNHSTIVSVTPSFEVSQTNNLFNVAGGQ